MVNSAFFFYKIKVPIVLHGIYIHTFSPKKPYHYILVRYNVNDLLMIWYQQITVLPLHFFSIRINYLCFTVQQGQPGVKNTLFVPPNNYPIRAFGALLDMLPNKVQPVYYSHSYPFDLLSVFCSLLKKHQI